MPDFTGLNYFQNKDKLDDKSLIAVWCYFCYRCGYIWLPRNFDISDIDTLDREPPKACARCKSKYYDRPRMDGEKNVSMKGFYAMQRRKGIKRRIIRH